MTIKCEESNTSTKRSTNDLTIELREIDFYLMYADNSKEEIKKFLNEIPIEELEEYILKRKSED